MKILLVEDNFIVALDLKARVESLGSEVIGPVASVAQAMALLDRVIPDGCFLDYQLRGETSIGIAERLLEVGVPFAFTSGYGELPMLPAALAHQLRVDKPIRAEDIAGALLLFEQRARER